MSNPKNIQEHFAPNHLGTKPRGFDGNKGKKYQNPTNKQPDLIQTKGE